MKRMTSYASPSDSTAREETEEEPPSSVDAPGANAQEDSTDMENISNQRREPDPFSTSLTPLERVARIEQDIDRLLISVEDPNVEKSLQGPIARVNPRFKGLVSRVYQGQQPAVQQKPSIVPKIQYHPHASTSGWSETYGVSEDTIRSLISHMYEYRVWQERREIVQLCEQLEKAKNRMI
ncbi:hypothetical protein J3E72DRAFT_273579 [Bipolaris maydis]|nr:hypothetical protein J3E74DRAFT_296016 [Bipolaris maydis]KAJ5052543.1 hypothetical protein J3E74DRAFT_295636 [Bipolaris maydis]KAJ6192224.1 hypothetical protein J3E72DRAFT_273579 [Bipolaris maydis]